MNPAGHPYTREELTGLKRADIQRICKDYGVRANMKTDALIELLLDTIHSNMSPLVRPPQPQPQHVPTPVRRVSTRSSSRASTLRSRGVSGSSAATSRTNNDTTAQIQPSVIGGTASRTSKSKVTQYRLGVGRPLATGNSGASFAKKLSGGSKLKRGRNSLSLRQSGEIIEEDSETVEHQPSAYAAPGSSRESQQINTSLAGDHDIVVRLDKLESVIRNAEIKQQFDTLKDLPSQVTWLKASLQQREEEVMTLRGELNIYRMELIALRGDVSKVFLLQDQLRTLKEALDQLTGSASSSAMAKGKLARRVSVPLSESNTNSLSPNKTSLAPATQTMTQMPQGNKSPAPSLRSTPSKHSNAAGKRVMIEGIDASESGETSEADPTRCVRHPSAKRARVGLDRRPLQEKVIGPICDSDSPSHDRESGEESSTSAGTSSDPSTAPSVGTPPATHLRGYLGESLDATQDVRTDDGVFNFSFRQATSSTPRDDLFNFFEEHEPFSPGSAMKAGSRVPKLSDDAVATSGLQSTHSETRRISNIAARPHTPTRSSGPDRFRVAADHISPIRDIASPFDPYDDDAFGLPFGTAGTSVGGFTRNETRGAGHMIMPMSMPLALGFGLGTASAGVLRDDTPVHPAARTMYGTELHNDTRFGDFGRDEIASTSNMNFWGPY
ncbi:hypothetical protein M0805_004784 [Coniferiporia weirii]|nr:hypothetical protein M0805_004784 [Coniferiporia weirii]